MEKERYCIVVDGINLPGYDSMESAQADIDKDPVLRMKNAVAARLVKPKPKKPFAEVKKELRLDS